MPPQKYSWSRKRREMQTQRMASHARLFHIRYGNLMLVVLGVAAGIWLLLKPELILSFVVETPLRFLGAFVFGFFYTYGVTAPASIAGFLLLGKAGNPVVIALIASVGAMLSNFLVYRFIRHKLLDHFDSLARRLRIRMHIVRYNIERRKVAKFLVLAVAGFIIASPLPTEIAIGLFAAIKFDLKKFLLYAFVFQFVGILLIGQVGKIL